ncbi:hypothetical protein BAPKO_0456 [Borreliella afzelii PKo]|nr:hypothetical protein BAPKO_0456 [Borreliella afzelii PKo]
MNYNLRTKKKNVPRGTFLNKKTNSLFNKF